MNRKIKFFLLGLVFWFLLFLGWEWWTSYPRVRFGAVPPPETFEEKIDSILTNSLTQYLIPGIAVGIVKEEKVIYLKAFGYANLATKDSMRLDSTFPVASVSKLITALGTANYALEKGLSPKTKLDCLSIRQNKLPNKIGNLSLINLLQHRTGLKETLSFEAYLKRNQKTPLLDLMNSLSESGPDTTAYYSDLNFDLLGYVLEKAENQEFSKLIDQRILRIGGMESSFFTEDWPLDYLPAKGYQQTFLWKRLEPVDTHFGHHPSPSSGLLTTAEDMSKLLLHLSREDMGVFSEELRWLRHESETPAGFQQISLNKMDFIGHYGGQGGFSALLIYSPKLDLGLFLMSNSHDKADFRNQIASQLFPLLTR
jgi:CubicO group peptidase (beta-lactamase class C family)